MAIEFKLPALSPTMEKGTLAKWLVQEGDVVRSGDLIAEVETDKATMEVEVHDAGRIAALVVPGGTENVPVGTVLALLTSADAPVEEVAAPAPSEAADPATVAVPSPAIATSAAPAPALPAIQLAAAVLDTTAQATPLARRLAALNGIDLARIVGSGPHGRVTRQDLRLAIAPLALPALPALPRLPSSAPLPPPATSAMPPPAGVPVATARLSTMRRTIARRLSESKQTVPHFYLSARCNIDPLLQLRSRINGDLAPHGIKLSVNDLLIKALAIALKREPEANVQFGGDVMHRFSRADIAMAVAIDGGLITPVIRGADGLSLSAIAETSKRLADLARAGKLLTEDYQGGTASISNLGMFGIDEMAPVINPPQALIMGIGAGIEQPWKVDGRIALATVMTATASFDHRAIDGATAARFMATFKDLIERPIALLA